MRSGVPACLAVVSLAAALALGAEPVERTETDDIFAAMRADRVVPPAAAPAVTLRALDGGSIRLTDLRGRVVILGFFVTG